jgi:RHS repeat-associated protein
VWHYQAKAQPFDAVAFYQCDHLGTPQELTDMNGEIAWAADYKAWGYAYDALSKAGRQAGLKQPLRFQGQYYDHETGLHYNRHRYYDPHSGRFVSKDPIGLAGGWNLHKYTHNPTHWVDPLGLSDDFYDPEGTGYPNYDPNFKGAVSGYNMKDSCQVKGSIAAAAGLGGVEEITINFKGEVSSYTGSATGLMWEKSIAGSCTLFGNDPEGLTNQIQIQLGSFGGSCAHSRNGLTCEISGGTPGLGISHSVGYTTKKYKLNKE